MATKRKKKIAATDRLIRSDKNLLALGIFSAALLLGVFIFIETPQYKKGHVEERTYRIQTEPATINQPSDTMAGQESSQSNEMETQSPESMEIPIEQ